MTHQIWVIRLGILCIDQYMYSCEKVSVQLWESSFKTWFIYLNVLVCVKSAHWEKWSMIVHSSAAILQSTILCMLPQIVHTVAKQKFVICFNTYCRCFSFILWLSADWTYLTGDNIFTKQTSVLYNMTWNPVANCVYIIAVKLAEVAIGVLQETQQWSYNSACQLWEVFLVR